MIKHGLKIVVLSLVLLATNDIISQNCVECIDNFATGYKSTAIGFGSRAIGDYSFVSGWGSIASGNSSVSMGYNSNADGHYSVAIGPYTFAASQSYALGDHAIANAQTSVVIGHYVQSNASRAFVIGSALSSSPLINSTASSLMVGFESDFPTLFIGPTAYGSQFGNVGIGTITPNATLDINGDLLCKGFGMTQPDIREGMVLTTIDTHGNAIWAPSQSISLWYPTGDGGAFIVEGNVGIGIGNPLSKLEIKGQVSVGYHVNSLKENNLLVAGRVGIGTEFPDEFVKLDVNGKIKSTELQLLNGQLNGNILQCDNEGNATWVDPSLINDGDWTLLANNLFVDPGRYVGIGTNTPTQALDVVGNVNLSGNIFGNHNDWQSLRLYANSNENDGAYITMNGISGDAGSIKLFARGIEGCVEFHNANRQIMSVRDDNNVYVGDADPLNTSNLIVYGEVKAHIIRATATIGWWDCVFETDYKLMPLLQLEKFVNENHHLPDMPSEDEVHKDGLDIAKMNALLLKKVEELTLYVIEQQKRIERLEEVQK